jgi:hypothetical protein
MPLRLQSEEEDGSAADAFDGPKLSRNACVEGDTVELAERRLIAEPASLEARKGEACGQVLAAFGGVG